MNPKTLLVMRHAKAARDAATWEDFDRPLNVRGERDSVTMAQWMADQGWLPNAICCSASVRTRMTAERVVEALNSSVQPTYRRELYHAPPRSYLLEIGQQPVAVHCLLIIGHNPGLEELIEQISGHFATLPTSAIARLPFPAADWSEINRMTLDLAEVVTPKSLQ